MHALGARVEQNRIFLSEALGYVKEAPAEFV